MGNGTRAFAVAAEQAQRENPLKAAEQTTEQNGNMIDGSHLQNHCLRTGEYNLSCTFLHPLILQEKPRGEFPELLAQDCLCPNHKVVESGTGQLRNNNSFAFGSISVEPTRKGIKKKYKQNL